LLGVAIEVARKHERGDLSPVDALPIALQEARIAHLNGGRSARDGGKAVFTRA
jgi:hypothetical protein